MLYRLSLSDITAGHKEIRQKQGGASGLAYLFSCCSTYLYGVRRLGTQPPHVCTTSMKERKWRTVVPFESVQIVPRMADMQCNIDVVVYH